MPTRCWSPRKGRTRGTPLPRRCACCATAARRSARRCARRSIPARAASSSSGCCTPTTRPPSPSSPARPRPPPPKRSTTPSCAVSRPSARLLRNPCLEEKSMPNERPEFRPIETAPARRIWPFAVMGAIIAGLVIWILRHDGAGARPKQVALATVAPKPKPIAAAGPKIEPLVQPEAAKPKDTNVIGSAVAVAGKLAMVARAELDRELGRTKAAQKQADAYKKQIGTLEKELTEARAQIAAIQKAHAPPPASDQ